MVLKANFLVCLFLGINSADIIEPTYVVNVKTVFCSPREWIYFYFKVKWIWSEVKWSDWSEVSYGNVLVDKGAMYNRAILYCRHLIILWLFHLGISCTVFVLICTVVVLYCFVMCVCECVYVCVCVCVCGCEGGCVMCGCFGNMYTVL
jgi:hypothetical protein